MSQKAGGSGSSRQWPVPSVACQCRLLPDPPRLLSLPSAQFFDDKSGWTGTAKNGGPTTNDGTKDLKGLCDRTPADARGVSKGSKFCSK